MMIRAFTAALAVTIPAPQPVVDFNNFTYRVHPCPSNVPTAAVMSRGTYSYYDKHMGQGFTVRVKSVTAGSLGTGTHQAAVILACDFPMGGTAAAYLYDIHGGAATLLGKIATANWSADWGAGPDSIHIGFAHDELSVTACANAACEKNALTRYALRNGKLTIRNSTIMK